MTLGKKCHGQLHDIVLFRDYVQSKKNYEYCKRYRELSNPKKHHTIGRCGMNHAGLLRITNL